MPVRPTARSTSTAPARRCWKSFTHPDLRSPAETKAYLTELKLLLTHLGVSDCNMQEGSLRVDANVNLHIDTPTGKVATPIVEIKNMNSFRARREGGGLRSGAAQFRLARVGQEARRPRRLQADARQGRHGQTSRAANARRKNPATIATSPIPTWSR